MKSCFCVTLVWTRRCFHEELCWKNKTVPSRWRIRVGIRIWEHRYDDESEIALVAVNWVWCFRRRPPGKPWRAGCAFSRLWRSYWSLCVHSWLIQKTDGVCVLGPFDLCHYLFPRRMVRLMPRCKFIRIMMIKAGCWRINGRVWFSLLLRFVVRWPCLLILLLIMFV